MLAALLYLVGAIVTAVAPDLAIMIIGRFVFGIGIGLVSFPLSAVNICLLKTKLFNGTNFF